MDAGARALTAVAAATLAAALATAPLAAQSAAPAAPADSLLDHLIGTWVLEGPMAGRQVVHDVTFSWVLGREYVQLHEISRERTATGAPAYEAIVYIMRDPSTGQYACLWLDNTAACPSIRAASATPSPPAIPSRSCSVTRPPTAFETPSSMSEPRTPGSGTWTTSTPAPSSRLPA